MRLQFMSSCFPLGPFMIRRVMHLTVAVTACALCPFSISHAQTMEPLSYTNSPIGLNFLIAGYTHQSGSVLADPSLPIKNVKATVDGAFLAYSHVLDCWGQSGSLALVVPYAWLSASGDVLEQNRSVGRTGLSDLSLRLSINLYGAPALSLKQFSSYHQDTIIGVSLRETAPSGQYFPSKLVNIGTNRWSFAPEVGASKRLGRWTFEAATGATFFTDDGRFFGNNVRREDPMFSAQGHVIYNFNPKLWVALDGTYYTGGRTSLNGSLDNDLQRNSRWGATFAYSLARHNSIKLYFSSGVAARTGTDFRISGIAWQYRWGAGL
jgi:hypothetical protein